MWDNFVPFLKKDYTIHVPELPGHGKQDYCGEETIEAIASSVASRIPDNSVVVGHSMGGYVAVSIAKLFPEKVNSLCLFHSRAGEDEPEKKLNRDRAIIAAQKNKGLYVQTLISGLFNPTLKDLYYRVINAQISEAKKMKTEAIVGSLLAMKHRPDHKEFMKNRSFPLYYFLGGADPVLPINIVKEEISFLPGSVAHIADKAGHMGHFESTREAQEFIQRIARAEYS